MAYINGKDGIYAPNIYDCAENELRELIERKKTSYRVPNGITFIGGYAFAWDFTLREIWLPEGLTEIKHSAFDGSSVETIHLPRTLEYIRASAMPNSGLTQCEIPTDNLVEVGKNAFRNCQKLQTVWFLSNSKNKLPEIHGDAFFYIWVNAPLTSIYVPWSEGAVAGAPWGAYNATIYYNSVRWPE